MITKTAASLTFGAACLLASATISAAQVQTATTAGETVVTNGPQSSPGDGSPAWSARQNVVESRQYDRLLQTNRAFRQARMWKECGPITDQELHASCIASFDRDEPLVSSSQPVPGSSAR